MIPIFQKTEGRRQFVKLFPICFLVVILLITPTAYGQVKEASKNLKQQADKMVAALLNGDYAAFTGYTNPALANAMGGTSKIAAILEKGVKDMQAQGFSFHHITLDEPSKIIKSGAELQATIAEHLEIKMAGGKLVNTSILIAFSSDNGNTWTFIDAADKDMVTLRKVLPNISPAITIPIKRAPVFVKD